MQRPIMDPLFLRDDPEPSARPPAINWGLLRAALRGVGWLVSTLFSDPLRRRGRRHETDDQGIGARFFRGATSRLVFLPLLVGLSVAVLVYNGTHPPTPAEGPGPSSVGLYYEVVDFTSDDTTRLRGWIVPAIDANRVLEGSEPSLGTRHPGVVLAHDYGQSPSQFLPLLVPLHEAGFSVLAVGLRGVGLGRPMGQTFGTNESKDIAAAVQVLRGHPSVDPGRIAVLGLGTGANAALLAANRDSGIAALALADPVADSRQAVDRYIGPNYWALGWMQPLCRWGLEIGYRTGPDEIDLSRFPFTLSDEKTFRDGDYRETDGSLSPTFVREATAFLSQRLGNSGGRGF